MDTKRLVDVLNFVKHVFVGKDEIVDLLGIALLARENAFLFGPPGTAKSAIVRQLSLCVEDGKNFEYLLTRFTEPNELFGPFDIRKLKEGDLVTNTEGMMPEASLIFLDEIFNANSAILNSLLLALNEKLFRRGKEVKQLPALMFVGASNMLPEDETLAALLDRFLIRVNCDYVDTDLLESVLHAGWKLESNVLDSRPTITPDEILSMQKHTRAVDLTPIIKDYVNLVHTIRNAGIKVSDRRAVKVQALIAASAAICGRTEANISDLWVLKYIWDTEEQIEVLAGIIDKIIENDQSESQHPQARLNKIPDPEVLAKEVLLLSNKFTNEDTTYEGLNTLKDKLRFIQNRANWIQASEAKNQLLQNIEELWKRILKTA